MIQLAKDRAGHDAGKIHMTVYGSYPVSTTLSQQTGADLLERYHTEWLHLAGVVDYEKGVINLYLNGMLEDSQPLLDNFAVSPTAHLRIGYTVYSSNSDNGDISYGYEGALMDDVRIYNRALSDAEVKQLAKVTLTVSTVGNGTVTTIPEGINCGTVCTATYPQGSSVALTAAGATFVGWGGDCNSVNTTNPTVVITMDTPKNCTALFGSTPSPCTYSIAPTSNSHSPNAETGMVNVTTPAANCAWTATSNIDWITITSGNTGQGNSTVTYSVIANPSPQSRNGTLTIANQTFTITQAGKEVVLVPDIRIEPTTLTFPS